ncbi:hypothetical protein HID58_061202, partial [Brassica napus]
EGKSEVVDQKRINKVHDNRVSHLLSHTVNGKGKAASNSVTIGKQLHDHNTRDSRSASLSKATIFDGGNIPAAALKVAKRPENGGKLIVLLRQPERAKTAFQDLNRWSSGPKMTVAWKRSSIIQLGFMISRRWDPGNGGGERVDLQEQQGTEWGFLDWAMLPNLRGFDLDIRNGYFGKLRRTRVSEISITISIIIKTKSQRSTGIESGCLKILYCFSFKENGGSTKAIWRVVISSVYDNKIPWRRLGTRFHKEYQLEIYGIKGDQPWLGYLENGIYYKGDIGSEAKEDGEIRDPVVIDKILPSQEFQEQLTLGTEAISDPMEVEKGLQMIQGLVEKQPVLEDDKVMNMDEFRAVFLEHGIDLDAADSLPDVSDSELEEMMKEQEEGDNTQRELEIGTNAEEKEQVDEVTGKKHASRKRLLKASLGTAVSTKMRIASALASPRKRAPTKTGTRHGDNVKQQESKGP